MANLTSQLSKPVILFHRLCFMCFSQMFFMAFISLCFGQSLYFNTARAQGTVDAMEKRANQVRQNLKQHLDDFEMGRFGVSALETFCSSWQPEEMFRRFPLLKAELKMCLGRTAMARKKWLQSQKYLKQAKLIAFNAHPDLAESRALQVQSDYWQADAHRQKLTVLMKDCPNTLGLKVLHDTQSTRILKHLEEAQSHYFQVVKRNTSPWSEMAAGQIAKMNQDFLETYYLLKPATYRGLALPMPFEVTRLGKFRLGRELNPQYPLILNEIDRLIIQLRNNPGRTAHLSLPALEERQRQLKSFTQATTVTVKNPFMRQKDITEGTIAWRNEKMMHKTITGTWRPIEPEEKQHLLGLVLKDGPAPTAEFLLAWIAQTIDGTPVDDEWIAWALNHQSARVRFVGLHILELKPEPKYLPVLLEHWRKIQPANHDFSALFNTLDRALFGLPERNLLAIRSLVKQHRQVAIKLFHSNNLLPASERAWLLAEFRDTHLVYRYHAMADHPQKEVVAIGLYASYLTTPKKALWLLNKNSNNKSAEIRCVARALLALEQKNEHSKHQH